MNKFDDLINIVSEQLGSSMGLSINPKQIESDMKRALSNAPTNTKKAIEAVSGALEKNTDTDPADDILGKLENIDFENMPDEKKGKFLEMLLKAGVPLKTSEEQQNSNIVNQKQQTNPAAYGV
jgi:hypothetical protein